MIEQTVGDLYDRCVQQFAKHTALSCGERRYTYGELGDKGRSLTSALQGLGVIKGTKVAFLMANCAEYVFCEYAVAKCGAIRVPLAVLLGNDDHIHMVELTGCEVLIYHEKLAERVLRMLPELGSVKHVICVSEAADAVPPGHLHLQSLIESADHQYQPVEIASEDLAGIYFTGGTTGLPKGVTLSHRAWIYTFLSEMLEFDIGWNEVFVFTTPLTHAGGCFLLPVLLRRGNCVIVDQFTPQGLLQAIEGHRATMTLLVPTMIYLLLDHPQLRQYDLSSLKTILYGAAPIAPERLKQAIEVFGPVMAQFFGQTEAPMMISALPREDHIVEDPQRERQILASAGRPSLHTELRLLDDDGNQVADGESGEVVVRCANMMSGYYRNPEATASTIVDGWLHTGDVAWQDEEGYLYIVDRKKDMIISGGFNIYPREVEDVLFEYAGVKQAAVVGLPHEKWGEEAVAVVVLDNASDPLDKQALTDFIKLRKGSLMAPKHIEYWDEIPVTNLGKVDKKAIRKILARNRELKGVQAQ